MLWELAGAARSAMLTATGHAAVKAAARAGSLPLLQRLLDAVPDVDDALLRSLATLLVGAHILNDADDGGESYRALVAYAPLVRRLVQVGLPSKLREQAIAVAVRDGQPDVVELLLTGEGASDFDGPRRGD